jgi:predicted HTH transcriptional regulator
MDIEIIEAKAFGDIVFLLSEMGEQYVCYAYSSSSGNQQAELLPYEIGSAVFPKMRRPYLQTPHNGTETSRKAARADFTSIKQRIYFYIAQNVDVTTEDVCKSLNVRHQTASARISDLWREGKIERTGSRKVSSGTPQFTYSVV